jgi:hypothetical protein
MQNPTISATSQFIAPYDTLPNILYTNPTTIVIKPLPIPIGNNPTLAGASQFIKPFDILPNIIYTGPTTKPNPQFNAPFDIPNGKLPSPFGFASLEQFNNDVESTVNWNPNTTINLYDIDNYEKDSSGNIKDIKGNVKSGPSAIWQPLAATNTNVTIQTAAAKAAAFGLSALGGFTGIPYVTQVGQSLTGEFGDDNLSGEFVTLQQDSLTRVPGIKYADFRSRKLPGLTVSNLGQQTLASLSSIRADGLAASLRSKGIAQIYATTSASPFGAYSVFNLEAWYGWGEHDNPNAIRNDFTLRSHVATRFKKGQTVTVVDVDASGNPIGKPNTRKSLGTMVPTNNPIEQATPFRGDKVTVIDFSQRKLSEAYQWKPKRTLLGKELPALANLTQDFIKFYFTGPKLQAGNEDDEDDIIVFRAVISSFSENFNPNWTDQKMIGRADPNYIYTGLTRDMSLEFDIYATDRDELKPIYRKLNALAGYTAPTYDPESIAMQAPWMRITIGDLFVQTPVVMTSLGYTYALDASWEINIERDLQMMQVPKKISVSCGFNVISDYLPQKGGRFWTLAKKFESDGTPIAGNDNWLSDTLGNIQKADLKFKDPAKGKVVGNDSSKKTETTNNNTTKT